jgi:glycosyltransferase involved in cell wall biosynthesis
MTAHGKIRVGLWVPTWCSGGVEHYHLAAAKACAAFAQRVDWVRCCVPAGGKIIPEMVDQVDRLMAFTTDIESMKDLCDVIVVWGIADISALDDWPGQVVVIQHGDNVWSRIWLNRLLRSSNRELHCAAVSQAAATTWHEMQLDSTIVRAGIDLKRLVPTKPRETLRAELGYGVHDTVVGYVGRFSPEKNPMVVAKLAGHSPNWHALYHGYAAGDRAPFVADAIQHSQGRVRFVGPDRPVADTFAVIDCLVVSSPHEGGPLVAAEAWITRTPLVSTNVGIVAENPGWAQLICHTGTIEEIDLAVRSALFARVAAPKHFDTMQDGAMRKYSFGSSARNWDRFLMNVMEGSI